MDYLDEVRRAALPDPHDERDIWCGPELRWCIKEIESLRSELQVAQTELAQYKQDAERYRWLLGGEWICDRMAKAYHTWDGSDGKAGFERVLDKAMKLEVK